MNRYEGGVRFLDPNYVSENPGFLPPEQLARIPAAISRLSLVNDPDPKSAEHIRNVAAKLHDELVSQAADPNAISDIMDAVRGLVASTGEFGGYANIERIAKGIADREQRVIDGMSNPPGQESSKDYTSRLRVMRTAVCFAVLAISEESKRDVVMGHLKARWLKPNKERALSYLDFEEHRPRKDLCAASPINHLLDIVALSEDPDQRDAALCEEAGYAAKEYLVRQILTDDERIIALGMKFLKYRHLVSILRQMPDVLSEGYIGGKAAGMILAYAAMEGVTPEFDEKFARKRGLRDTAELERKIDVKGRLRENKSTSNGSGVFAKIRSFNEELGGLVSTLKTKYRNGGAAPDELHCRIAEAMAQAKFPPHIRRHLETLFRSLHGRPITVRSSSKLEDRFGASFAGQYETVELANCGDFKADFELFRAAILKVYASVFSRKAMEYRKEKGLLGYDEEMGLLIQDLNGKQYGDYFYPDVSAVAMSRATQSIGGDPFRGAMRIAFGHGDTVVAGRQGRFVMFDNPYREAVVASEDIGQPNMVVINLKVGRKEQTDWQQLEECGGLSPHVKGNIERSSIGYGEEGEGQRDMTKLTLKPLVTDPVANIPLLIEYIVQKLKYQLGCDVDCELTLQYDKALGDWTVNIVQCRPQNIPENLKPSRMPEGIPKERVLIESPKSINGTLGKDMRYVLYIDPAVYGEHSRQVLGKVQKYVHAVNEFFSAQGKKGRKRYLVVSARRFGGTLKDDMAGIPAEFYDFSKAAGFVEVFDREGNSSPSFGEHFFQLIMDAEMFVGAAEEKESASVNHDFFRQAPCAPGLPQAPADIAKYVKVVDISEAWRETGESAKAAPNPRKKKWRVHLAQDNTEANGGLHMYIAEKGRDYPIPVKETDGGDEDDETQEEAAA